MTDAPKEMTVDEIKALLAGASPGPWESDADEGSTPHNVMPRVYSNPTGGALGATLLAEVGNVSLDQDQWEANARLIAKAPDLAASTIADAVLIGELEDRNTDLAAALNALAATSMEAVRDLEAALAKATGQEAAPGCEACDHTGKQADGETPCPCAEAAPTQEANLAAVRVVLAEGRGFWRSCTGCYETDEGYPTAPIDPVFGCERGGGCRECGGIGATWDTTDYEDMADWIGREELKDEQIRAALRMADETFRDLGWHAKFEVTSTALKVLSLEAEPEPNPASFRAGVRAAADALGKTLGMTLHRQQQAILAIALPEPAQAPAAHHWKDACRGTNGPEICDEPCARCAAPAAGPAPVRSPEAIERWSPMVNPENTFLRMSKEKEGHWVEYSAYQDLCEQVDELEATKSRLMSTASSEARKLAFGAVADAYRAASASVASLGAEGRDGVKIPPEMIASVAAQIFLETADNMELLAVKKGGTP